MKKHKDLLKLVDLLKAEDPESKKLGMKLFKQSSFMEQFRGNLSNLGFLVRNCNNKLAYMSYPVLCTHVKISPEIMLTQLANNNYKAFLIIKNNRLW